MRFFTFLLFISLVSISTAQNNYSKEISLISDNDLYTSLYRDGYYTNGFLSRIEVYKKPIKILLKKSINFKWVTRCLQHQNLPCNLHR